MRKRNPWTLLRNRLKPLTEVLHAAAPWRIEAPLTMEQWVKAQTWEELWIADEFCRWQLCGEPPRLSGILADLLAASEAEDASAELKQRITVQVMHRMIFSMDLSRAMSAAWRREFPLTGDFVSDSRLILIDAWRTNAVLVWANQCGHLYVGQPEE